MVKNNRKPWKKKRTFMRNWTQINDELVRRGHFYLELSWVKSWKRELATMNENKVGRPYQFPESLIKLQAIWQQFVDYRGVEGMTQAIYELGQIPMYNDYSTINRRVNKLKITFDIPPGKDLFVATDGSGMKLNMSGEYFYEKYGDGKKKFIKVTISADPFDKDIYKVDVSLEGEELSEPDVAMTHMAELVAEGHNIEKFWGDGSFDVHELFDFLDYYNIKSAVKIRKNAIIDPGGSVRRNIEVKKFQELGYKKWARKKHYGRRWVGTEGIFSSVKKKFGERTKAKTEENMIREIKRRFWAYEQMRKYAMA
jgi:hypothetical protein